MRFGIRDLLIATTVLAIHFGLLSWRFDGFTASLPIHPFEYIALLPGIALLAYLIHQRTRVIGPALRATPLLALRNGAPNWRSAWMTLVVAHAVIMWQALEGDPGTAVLFAHQAIVAIVGLTLLSPDVVIFENGIRSGPVFYTWAETTGCVGWEPDGWWLQVASKRTPGTPTRVPLTESQVEHATKVLAAKQTR